LERNVAFIHIWDIGVYYSNPKAEKKTGVMMMGRRLRHIIRKEFIQAFREPRMRILMIVPPILQLIIFGYAVNLDIENVKIVWMDKDDSPASRELRASFEGSACFSIIALAEDAAQAQSILDRGKAQAVVGVLPGFGRRIDSGRQAQVQVLVDGTNSNTAAIISNYASRVIAGYGGTLKIQRKASGNEGVSVYDNAPGNLTAPVLTAETRVWFNPELKSRYYFVPGVIANIILMITLMLTAMAVVREKEIGTMEQLMVTPIRPIELLLGKTLPFAVVGLLDVTVMTVLAVLMFKIPFQGSVWLLIGCSALFLLTSLGIGLFISTISNTQQQAMMSSFFFFMPAFMLSGFAFPIRNMPVLIQYATYFNPLRYFMEIVRGIFLKGVGPAILWPQILVLALYGVLVLGLSALRFRSRLD
jgi:ABC-2 type transport system permease protein